MESIKKIYWMTSDYPWKHCSRKSLGNGKSLENQIADLGKYINDRDGTKGIK